MPDLIATFRESSQLISKTVLNVETLIKLYFLSYLFKDKKSNVFHDSYNEESQGFQNSLNNRKNRF